jgi:hypothetical protein
MSKHVELTSIYAMAAAMSALDSPSMMHNERSNPNLECTPPKKVVTKGCKEYQFAGNGELTRYEDVTRFRCIALNLKTARRKFIKWEKLNK